MASPNRAHWLAIFASTFILTAQDPVFRTTTRLVEISAVATDGKGNPVTDLKKEDFIVLEDGKPQQVSHFFTESVLRNAPPPPRLPKGIYTNRPEFLPRAPKSVTAIVIDYLNTPWTSQTATREQLLAVLKTLGENDVVAIYTLSHTLTVLHDFTADKDTLEARLRKFDGMLTLQSKSTSDLISLSSNRWSSVFSERRADAEGAYLATMQRTRTMLTINSMALLARHMAGIPGRKNLIWMSAGFPVSVLPTNATTVRHLGAADGFRTANMPNPETAADSGSATLFLDAMERLIQTLNNAGVSVYGLDVMSLVVPMVNAEHGFSSAVTNQVLSQFTQSQHAKASLADLSARTGGVATLGAADLESPMRRALDDSHYSYALAYYTTNPKNDGKFRKIEIKLNRPGVKLRFREGYAAAERSVSPSPSAKADLDEAVRSPINQTAVLLTAQMLPKGADELSLVLQIEPTQLSFQQSGDAWEALLDLMFFQKTPEGKLNGIQVTLPMKLNQESYQAVLKKGLLYRRTVPRDAGAVALRVVVRDARNGATGTLDIPLQTP
jgi:VWFA-related protein